MVVVDWFLTGVMCAMWFLLVTVSPFLYFQAIPKKRPEVDVLEIANSFKVEE